VLPKLLCVIFYLFQSEISRILIVKLRMISNTFGLCIRSEMASLRAERKAWADENWLPTRSETKIKSLGSTQKLSKARAIEEMAGPMQRTSKETAFGKAHEAATVDRVISKREKIEAAELRRGRHVFILFFF